MYYNQIIIKMSGGRKTYRRKAHGGRKSRKACRGGRKSRRRH